MSPEEQPSSAGAPGQSSDAEAHKNEFGAFNVVSHRGVFTCCIEIFIVLFQRFMTFAISAVTAEWQFDLLLKCESVCDSESEIESYTMIRKDHKIVKIVKGREEEYVCMYERI